MEREEETGTCPVLSPKSNEGDRFQYQYWTSIRRTVSTSPSHGIRTELSYGISTLLTHPNPVVFQEHD
jgi:hypothetical protein